MPEIYIRAGQSGLLIGSSGGFVNHLREKYDTEIHVITRSLCDISGDEWKCVWVSVLTDALLCEIRHRLKQQNVIKFWPPPKEFSFRYDYEFHRETQTLEPRYQPASVDDSRALQQRPRYGVRPPPLVSATVSGAQKLVLTGHFRNDPPSPISPATPGRGTVWEQDEDIAIGGTNNYIIELLKRQIRVKDAEIERLREEVRRLEDREEKWNNGGYGREEGEVWHDDSKARKRARYERWLFGRD